MFTLENLIIAGLAIGLLFLFLGLMIFTNTIRIQKTQFKDFELLIDFIEEKSKPIESDTSRISRKEIQERDLALEEFRQNISDINNQIKLGDLPAIKVAMNGILDNQKSLKGISDALNEILKNQKEQAESKAVINITPIPNQSEKAVIDTSNTGTLILATIAITEQVLQDLHSVESIYNEKGEILPNINEDYTKTYDTVFKTLTENLL